jgi:hypothetical protein
MLDLIHRLTSTDANGDVNRDENGASAASQSCS